MKKSWIIGSVLTVLVVGIILFYSLVVLPTKIALVNFQDEQMAEIVKANTNWFIKPVQVDLKKDDFSSIVDYPVIYLFHISSLTEEQRENLKKAMDKGAKVHVFISTSDENKISNIEKKDLDYISACFENGGAENVRSLLNYSRKTFDAQSLFTDEVKNPVEYPKDVFYRIGTDVFFTDVNEYWNYYKKTSLYKEGRPVVALINSSVDPQTQYREYQDSIILNLEKRNYNVVALAGFRKRIENLQLINPDMIVYFPHGRLSMMGGDEVVDWLQKKNILLLTPQLIQQNYEDWMADQQGMSGGIFGQNIVVPELDGAIHPYAIAAKYKNENGIYSYKAIPGRINRFCETADRWLTLKSKPNSEKKLCIYYYKGAGKNAIVAGGLEVGSSILSLLNKLKQEGYTTGELPATAEELLDRIHKEGPLLGDYAKGSFDEFLKTGKPTLISAQEYESWCKSELDPSSYKEVVNSYGPAPGKYLTTTINDTSYLAIPRVLFGNIALLPVLPAAMEENEFKLVHGVKQAPPHAYIASYLWSRMAFKTDVVAHFGAHGSVEFTPWKQVVLSLKDWPEALVAPVPHLYIYSIDNIGEAMMAKRRTYATMVSHLTPAYSQAELYGDLKGLMDILHKYTLTEDLVLLSTYKEKIKVFADSLKIYKDLSLKPEDMEVLNEETINLLHDYVHHMEMEKITTGLHTFGVPYSEKEINESVRMMSVDPIASSLKELANLRGDLPEFYEHMHTHAHHHDSHEGNHPKHTDHDFASIATFISGEILKGKDPLSFISPEDRKELEKAKEQKHDEKHSSEGYHHYYDKKEDKKDTAHNHEPKHDKKDSDPHAHYHASVNTNAKPNANPHTSPHSNPHAHSHGDKESKKENPSAEVLKKLEESFLAVKTYKENLALSPGLELSSFINGMSGGFVAPSSGGDPVSNPLSVPTGKNLYSINAEITPTKDAFEKGKKMGEMVLQKHIAKHGDYPKKIAYSLWGGEFVRDQGVNIGQIFYMLGVEPVYNQRGRMHDVKLIPIEQLKRPRIDVVVQTSGQFRDIAASRVYMINKAIELASNAEDGDQYKNFVKEGTIQAENAMKEKGMSPADARKFATVRVFGGVNGHYGTGIMELVEQGDKWETEKEIADRYIQNMGAMYAEGSWSEYKEGMFEAMLQNTEVVMHPRSSNVTGPISLDHVYEFMGGLTASIRVSTGKDPDGYFNDFRNKFDPNVQDLKEAIWTEMRTNLLNPKFISAQMEEGPTAAENFAESFRDTYGWNVMKPDAIDKEIWEGYYDIYVKDKQQLGTIEFFRNKNPYALQEMTAVMLETIRKGYWKPDQQVIKDIAQLHGQLVKDHKAGCSGFVCNNAKLKSMIEELLEGSVKESYVAEINTVRTGSAGKEQKEGMILAREELTLESMKAMLKDNVKSVMALGLVIILMAGAVIYGIRKRNRE